MRDITNLSKVYRYFTPTELVRTHKLEATLLRDAKTLFSLLDNCKLIREIVPNDSGVADLLICLNGIFIAVELKSNVGTPSKQQLEFISDIKKANGIAGVCFSLADVLDLLRIGEQCGT